MSKNIVVKWGLLLVGSAFTLAGIGTCISQFLLQTFILNSVN
jgi:hypothetical protein